MASLRRKLAPVDIQDDCKVVSVPQPLVLSLSNSPEPVEGRGMESVNGSALRQAQGQRILPAAISGGVGVKSCGSVACGPTRGRPHPFGRLRTGHSLSRGRGNVPGVLDLGCGFVLQQRANDALGFLDVCCVIPQGHAFQQPHGIHYVRYRLPHPCDDDGP